jgi:hypothetical protein
MKVWIFKGEVHIGRGEAQKAAVDSIAAEKGED